MKKIEAIIRPAKVEAVREALKAVGYSGLAMTEVQGHGKQLGTTQQWRGEQYHLDLLPKIKVELVVQDKDVTNITAAIVQAARTGELGDGKIFISPIEEAIRIRTGETGNEAV